MDQTPSSLVPSLTIKEHASQLPINTIPILFPIPIQEKTDSILIEEIMACNKTRTRFALRRKLQILRTVTRSKSVKKTSIVMDACLYIHKLKLQVEAIRKEYQYLINRVQEVKVEKVGAGCLAVRLTCEKGEELLVPILEAFEEMNLDVVEARFTCKQCLFGMEAIVQTSIDAELLNEAILMLLQRQSELQSV